MALVARRTQTPTEPSTRWDPFGEFEDLHLRLAQLVLPSVMVLFGLPLSHLAAVLARAIHGAQGAARRCFRGH